jgi:predicted DNA-binding transcriptional regulator AlpA
MSSRKLDRFALKLGFFLCPTTVQDITSINGERLLRLPAVCSMTGLARSTLYRLIQRGEFPAPIHPLGHARFSAWRLSQVRGVD